MLYVYDYETTGIDPTKDRPVEVAVIDKDNIVHIDKRCDPKMDIPEEASKVHGITNDIVKNLPSYREVLLEQHELMKEGTIWAGYNIQAYDGVMFECCTHTPFNVDTIDVYTIVMRKFPLKESKKLTAIYREAFGRDFEGAHGAKADCMATLELLNAFKEYLGMTYSEMVEWLKVPEVYVRFPFGKYKGARLDQIPLSYVNWIERNWKVITPDLKVTLEEIKKCQS